MQALELPDLRDAPFRLGIGPSDAVAHRSWRAVQEAVLATLARGPARIAVLGDAGIGKTLLLHALAEDLQDRAVLIAGPSGIVAPLPSGAILLVDDADRLHADILGEFLRREGSCVVTASPGFVGRLPPMFTVRALSPLPPDEVARFVAVRLAEAGQRRDLLDPDAVLALARLSGGVPRQLNALAGAAVFLASLDGAERVGRRQVEEAAAMRDGEADVAPPAVSQGESALPVATGLPTAVAPTEAAPLQAPAEPLVPDASRRATPATARLAAAVGVLLLIGAALLGYVRSGPPANQGSGVGPVASAPGAVPPPAPAAPVAAPQAPGGSPADGSSSPPSATASRPRPSPARDTAPAAATPANPEPSVPSGARVVLHYRVGAAADADSLAALLAKEGARYGRVETRAVAGTPRAAAIRFFHAEDVAAAWALRSVLSASGDDWQVRDFTRFQPRPRRGTLEVWLP